MKINKPIETPWKTKFLVASLMLLIATIPMAQAVNMVFQPATTGVPGGSTNVLSTNAMTLNSFSIFNNSTNVLQVCLYDSELASNRYTVVGYTNRGQIVGICTNVVIDILGLTNIFTNACILWTTTQVATTVFTNQVIAKVSVLPTNSLVNFPVNMLLTRGLVITNDGHNGQVQFNFNYSPIR